METWDWRRPFWLSLLVGASVAFTLGFACATPFAAFAAAAACTLSRRDAYYLGGAVWLVNQAVGFTCLGYPWTANTLAWGAGIGIAALLATFVARLAVVRLAEFPVMLRNTVAFLAAFVAYEAVLIGFAFVLGGLEDFTLPIQSRILAINVAALLGVFALNWLGASIGLAASLARRGPKS